ncbi:MAG: hypothetical protein IPP91_18025 [Betaproteobacteria bacterium]|nr:hypothetical protein [Betaproteobacteria bacterium]
MKAHASSIIRRGLACFLSGLALPAAALGMGDLQVHSSLGEPLDATVALKTLPGEAVEPGCFRLGNARATDLLVAAQPTIAIETLAAASRLRLRTVSAIQEPVLQIRLNASCPGGRATTRDYELLFSARAVLPQAAARDAAGTTTGPAPGDATGTATRESAPPGGQGFRALPGDTLASIATAIYPKNRRAREAYLQALRAGNTSLASLAPDEPLPPGTEIALPDLRRFSMSLATTPEVAPARKQEVATSPATTPPGSSTPRRSADDTGRPPAASKVADPQRETAVAAKTDAPKPERPPASKAPAAIREAPAPKPPASTKATPRASPFVLRLSSAEVDLSRSRGIDDRTRSQLRERLLVLDADDQVAALLTMRHSLRQLEGRVAELQLKLSALSPAAPAKPAAPAAPAMPAAALAPAPLPAPVAPAPVPAVPANPAIEKPTPPVPAAKPAAPDSRPAVPDKAPLPEPRTGASDKKPTPPAPSASPDQSVSQANGAPSWLWGVLALLVAGIAALAWHLSSRRRKVAPPPKAASAASDLDEAEALMRGSSASSAGQTALPDEAEHRVVADSDASLATRIPGADPTALRRRYIEERFPEIAGGTINLDQPESIVKAARLFYEDGAIARAIELLQFAAEENPASLKPWLALFEIFRLENLSGAFTELAARFQEHHGSSQDWRKVQFIGREIDPGNALYREAPVNNLETIGYSASKAIMPVTFDPLAENWLNAPMDFTTDAHAASLHAGLLADAGLNDSDLAADPMPALKNVEMFNVA